jgi:hypothetical protein
MFWPPQEQEVDSETNTIVHLSRPDCVVRQPAPDSDPTAALAPERTEQRHRCAHRAPSINNHLLWQVSCNIANRGAAILVSNRNDIAVFGPHCPPRNHLSSEIEVRFRGFVSFHLPCRSAARRFVSVSFAAFRAGDCRLKMARIAEILRSPNRELVPNEILFAYNRYANALKLDADAAWPRGIEIDARKWSK